MIAKWMIWCLLLSSPVPGVPPQATQNTHSPHGNLNLPCQNCHTVYGWKPIRSVPEFDHKQTRYPLRGMHEVVACAACHTKMVFTNVGNKCADCHADLHKRQMGAACESCHTVRGWKVSVQQINQHMNRFPLTGAHAAVTCEDCHKNGALSQFNTMSTTCLSCHQKDFQATKNPDHVAGKFATTCESCHSTDNWLNARFDHNKTKFALTGSHTVPPRTCADCHINNNYNLTQTMCVSCHQQDYNNAVSPVNHVQAGLPLTCETCHDAVAWTDGKFDHAQTGWALTGSHTVPPRQCADCHVNNNYKLNNTACVTCHLTDFNNTSNPNHVQAGFPQTCGVCHDTIKWTDANFDHNKTGFSLAGSHTVPARACADCHVNNNYKNLPTDCYSCHKADYQNANNPNHIAAHFPTTCASCHGPVKWTNGKFNHTWFPLNHGNANGVCGTCHTNPNDYSVFTCTNCHTKAQTDPRHRGVGGYVYNSVNCYQCHKGGGG